MARLSQEEIDDLTRRYLQLKQQAEGDSNFQLEFKKYQNYCVDKLKYLVLMKTAKYRKFSNYSDLTQDGFEALIKAFDSFDPEKGCFTWWADKYISTRVSRAANAHSTIKFPIKKAKEMRPYKTSSIPVMIDWEADPFKDALASQKKKILHRALRKLPVEHLQLISKVYGLNGERSRSVKKVLNEMNITRAQYAKLLREAKKIIKKEVNEGING